MEIFFVRHGATEWNRQRRWQGMSDVPLSELGRAQARACGEYLRSLIQSPAAIYTSDLSRARETGEIIASVYGLGVIANPRLREAHVGLWNGLEIEESFRTHGKLIRAWREDPWIRLPDTEPLGEVQRRSSAFLNHLGETHEGESVVVVSHALFIRTLVCYVVRLPLANHYLFELDNCSITPVSSREDGWRLAGLNLRDYLRGLK